MRCIEGCLLLATDLRLSARRLERMQVWLGVLGIFKAGVVVMDEVDWVLHPLKVISHDLP